MNAGLAWAVFALAAGGVFLGSSSRAATDASSPVAVGSTFRDCPDDCPDLVLVPAGEFNMGSPVDEDGRDQQEGPLHKVAFKAPFFVGKYDVTVGQFARFVADTNYAAAPCKDGPGLTWRNPGFPQDDRSPVVCVNFDDVQAYLAWLSKKAGHSYRLLSEAEQEYVNRSGVSTAYWWGSKVGANHANCKGCGSVWDNKRTSPVGSFPPNRFGLYDTTGDVYIWVADCWSDSYADAPTDGSPNTSGDCTKRGLRGGGWGSPVIHARAAFRLADPMSNSYANMGFRVARDH